MCPLLVCTLVLVELVFSLSMGGSGSGDLLSGSGLGFKCNLFLRSSVPLGDLTTNDLGSSHFSVTFAGLQVLDRLSYITTLCPGTRSERFLFALLSYRNFCSC